MFKSNKKIQIIGGIIIIIVFIIISFFLNKNNDEFDTINNEQVFINNINSEQKSEEKNNNLILVHIAGCVNNPGIVELEDNSRVANAIEKAGGLTEDADLTQINLAYLLEDGMKIVIPNKSDNNNSSLTQENNILENNILSTNENEDNKQINGNIKININAANQQELETLPGIGAQLAQRIINYRKENGKYNSIEDIKNVKGIGTNKYENIKELIICK